MRKIIDKYHNHPWIVAIAAVSSILGLALTIYSLLPSKKPDIPPDNKPPAPTPQVFQETPAIRTAYLRMEGTTLLNRALRGYGFSPDEGFTFKPIWLKNEVYNNLQSMLEMCNEQKGHSAQSDFTEMSWYAGTEDGKELWSAEIGNGQVIKRSSTSDKNSSSRTNTPNSEKFYSGASPCRNPSFAGLFNIDGMLGLVQTSPYWQIDSKSEAQVIPFDEYEIFALPDSEEALRYTTDPFSKEMLKSRPDLRDIVFFTADFAHDGYNGTIWVREIKLLVLDVENVGDKPIGLSSLKQKIVTSDSPFQIRTGNENDQALATAAVQEKALPLELLRPNEHLFIPLQVQFGFATALKDLPDYNYEACIQKHILPTEWWKKRPGESILLEVLRSTDGEGNPQTEVYELKKSVLENKPKVESLIEPTYYAGHSVDVKEIVFKTGAGTLTPWPVRQFQPNNLLAKGAFEGGSCPILFSETLEHGWRRISPVLVNCVTRARQKEIAVTLSDAADSFMISELETETTFLDSVRLRVTDSKGRTFILSPDRNDLLRATDGRYAKIEPGSQIGVRFSVPPALKGDGARQLLLTGYYVPTSLVGSSN